MSEGILALPIDLEDAVNITASSIQSLTFLQFFWLIMNALKKAAAMRKMMIEPKPISGCP